MLLDRTTMKGVISYFMTHPVSSVTAALASGEIVTIQNPWYQPAMLEFVAPPLEPVVLLANTAPNVGME